MTPDAPIQQRPLPGTRLIKYRGDTQAFDLFLDRPLNGAAWIRTNIGHGGIRRREIIDEVDRGRPFLGKDWFDIPMQRVAGHHFRIRLPLVEVGHFEAKCFFLEDGSTQPIWPPGSNTVLNVEPADTCCANIIYNAFVRQFGSSKTGGLVPPVAPDQLQALDDAGYAVIPPSGKFRDLIDHLDFIIETLGCRIIQLLPIHPTPTTYGRMGRYGSPYAALSFKDVDPALAEFDPKATPLEQFAELVRAVHARNAKLHIDIAINHTGWAASLHESHPNWLMRDDKGQIEVPGAWGVQWEDLTKLDYSHLDLWQYMADVLLTWCRRGVDGFRCDAGYMIPVPVWRYVIAKVRHQFPDTVFNLEGLGGKISVTRDLLDRGNFNWAYSELFQNYDRGQIESYLPEVIDISEQDGLLIHFAETHDNPRLAAHSPDYARMRTALCALFSHQGGFGYANGVEWLATEKINVHNAPSLNWGAPENLVDHLRHLSALLHQHPAFECHTDIRLIQQQGGNQLVLQRHHRPTDKQLLVVVNLDLTRPTEGCWNVSDTVTPVPSFWDMLTGESVTAEVTDGYCRVPLAPAQVLCLTSDPADLAYTAAERCRFSEPPRRILQQQLRAKALEVICHYAGTVDLGALDVDDAAAFLKADPVEFCRSLNQHSDESRVVLWQWPRDLNRVVMLPPGHFLLLTAPNAFGVCLAGERRTLGSQSALPTDGGLYFALFSPLPPPAKTPRTLQLLITPYGGNPNSAKTTDKKTIARLCLLPNPANIEVRRQFSATELKRRPLLALGTNGRGAMMRAHASWGRLMSRYDALLAANHDIKVPEDRWVVLTRCRGWVVYQGFSQEIGDDCLHAFHFQHSAGAGWRFHVPTGQGQHIVLSANLHMEKGLNAVHMSFFRHPAGNDPNILPDDSPIELILRPDIENRNFHDTTKAFQGPERLWPASIESHAEGFSFRLDDHGRLDVSLSEGAFVWEPEWHYMIHRPQDAERHLDPDSDLFSPGYFKVGLGGNQKADLLAICRDPGQFGDTPRPYVPLPASDAVSSPEPAALTMDSALKASLDQFLVERQDLKSVIAGFPWFLDWGRDALIFSRGLIGSGRFESARAVLKLFGRFESGGTLPNMIHGQRDGNRDTSDAPLWLVVACAELTAAQNDRGFLDEVWNGRCLRDILLSIGKSYIRGTPNGIVMDPDSGLIFSPAHFSWMDTNHPAATPREGYPIEIQALWVAALSFLAVIDTEPSKKTWQTIARRAKTSIAELYYRNDDGYLSDCLHGANGIPAGQAQTDDALRPNQLLAVTLGAFDDRMRARRILDACSELLVPGGIRSLADRPLEVPLEIRHNGHLLSDPFRPYRGVYRGDEDTMRKPAYHNGTAWTWPYPAFCEAWVQVYGPSAKSTALAWLSMAADLMNQGCAGHIPEILDGDSPHIPRGCDAQAWSASEFLRVWLKLSSPSSIDA